MTTTQHGRAVEDQADADADFVQRAEAYRRELFAHCYRMSGSVHDAEDLVQETLVRAWRSQHTFQERASLRTWLHRIATNVCLTALEKREKRPLPTGLGQPAADPDRPLADPLATPWLTPVPDSLVTGTAPGAGPQEAAETMEGIRLAFVAALQHLPPRQRAALVLRDVLQWRAVEVAEAVGTSVAAVNSALQRARETLRQAGLERDRAQAATELTAEQEELLRRYVAAFWEKDVDALAGMFTETAVWEMPPFPEWYQGPDHIAALIGTKCPGGAHEMVMLATRANSQPAFGLYMRGEDGDLHPFHLQVLDLDGDRVAHVGAFFDHSLFPRFGLPPVLRADDPVVAAGASAGG